MSNSVNYPLFSVTGVEIEYMIVNKQSLEIQSIADLALAEIAGEIVNEACLENELGVSNELALHVIELKTMPPE